MTMLFPETNWLFTLDKDRSSECVNRSQGGIDSQLACHGILLTRARGAKRRLCDGLHIMIVSQLQSGHMDQTHMIARHELCIVLQYGRD